MAWKTERIVAQRMYRPADVEKEIGISRTTLKRWRQEGKLQCVSTSKTMKFTGQRLIEAIDGRLRAA